MLLGNSKNELSEIVAALEALLSRDTILTRRQLAEKSEQANVPVAESSLATMASRGIGADLHQVREPLPVSVGRLRRLGGQQIDGGALYLRTSCEGRSVMAHTKNPVAGGDRASEDVMRGG